MHVYREKPHLVFGTLRDFRHPLGVLGHIACGEEGTTVVCSFAFFIWCLFKTFHFLYFIDSMKKLAYLFM